LVVLVSQHVLAVGSILSHLGLSLFGLLLLCYPGGFLFGSILLLLVGDFLEAVELFSV
jgi:hypothetical protein